MNAFLDYYRCPAELSPFGPQPSLSAAPGYFTFDKAAVFGRVAGTQPAPYFAESLPDVSLAATVEHGRPQLPFDLSEVVTNLREERYRQNGQSWLQSTPAGSAARRVYYALRPFMTVGVRKYLQKLHLNSWTTIAFPDWPVDTTVDRLMDSAMVLAMQAHGVSRVPFIWFWPDRASACAMVTHDVEGQEGIDFCDALTRIDESYGFKSAFQIIPQGNEGIWHATASRLRERGFEVNLHDLNHDGRLFENKTEFLRRAKRINEYAREFHCEGFRSAVMYRQQEWFDAFEFAYDMSVPNAAHLEPQRGGCCTVMPYFIGDVLELPLTTAQDYSLFHIINDYSTTLWREQIRLIRKRHGLISVITHPDYLVEERERAVYLELLRHLSELREREGIWSALPGEINRWWRQRAQMRLVPEGRDWRIEGPGSECASVAYAALEDGRLVYELADARRADARDMATAS